MKQGITKSILVIYYSLFIIFISIMSLFRTLQSSPATITIFHNSKTPMSSMLYKTLELTVSKLNSSPKKDDQFIIDVMKDKMPTFDQFKSIVQMNGIKPEIIKKIYPLLSDRTDMNKRVTVKGKPSLFNEGEYALIYDAFNELISHPDKEVDPSHIFHAPLVIDWDQNLAAVDPSGVKEILNKYSH